EYTFSFFFNDTNTTEIYTLSLHDALPICHQVLVEQGAGLGSSISDTDFGAAGARAVGAEDAWGADLVVKVKEPQEPELGLLRERSEEHTSELQSRGHLVCRLLLEKKNKQP